MARGARATVVTAGSAGAALATPDATTCWRGLRVAALNPVGAGDCLVAGVVAGLADGEPLDGATRRGIAMAAASCETFAAGELAPRRYEELLAQVDSGEQSR